MAKSYASQHSNALRTVTKSGAAVTFTDSVRTGYAPLTGVSTLTETAMAGFAVKVRGDLKRYQELSLVVNKTVTLIFAPATFGDVPELGALVTWGGSDYTMRDVQDVSPSGNSILSRVIISE